MNHITQRNKLDFLLKSYTDFMKTCPSGSVVKLAKEITRLQARISIIRMMDYHHLHEPVIVQYETKQSKINKSTYKEPIDLLNKIIEKDFLKT